MTRPDFQRATAISFAAHALIFLTALVVMSLSPSHKSKVYTIDLVSPSAGSVRKRVKPRPARRTPPPKVMPAAPVKPAKRTPPAKKPAMAVKKDPAPAKKEPAPEVSQQKTRQAIDKLRQEEAEAQKQKRLKEMEDERRLDELRSRLAAEGASATSGQVPEGERNGIMTSYSNRIMTSIKQNWVFPDVVRSPGLRTEVSITVFADGTIRINRVISPSDNRAFDQSVLKAIIKTKEVDPPPFGRNEDVILNFIPAE